MTLRESVVNTLCYFDLFNYPLTGDEIVAYASIALESETAMKNVLTEMQQEGSLYFNGEFFALRPLAGIAERRKLGNHQADNSMYKARRMSRLISRFPYVRAVMLSGSISKGYMAEDGDVDFFVVTKPGRLWLARTALMLYKKLFLLNSHKYFCVNYLISSDTLEIPDKNLFTATEIVTLIPTYNSRLYIDFMRVNQWAYRQYPAFGMREVKMVQEPGKESLKKALERLFSGKLGDRLEQRSLKYTLKFWKRKFSHFDAETFELALRSNTNTSKHHPRNFQKKVLNKYEERLAKYRYLFDPKREMAS